MMISRNLGGTGSGDDANSNDETIKWYWSKAFKGVLTFGLLIALLTGVCLSFSRIDVAVGLPLSLLLSLVLSYYVLRHVLQMLKFLASCRYLRIHQLKSLTLLGIYSCIFIFVVATSTPFDFGDSASDGLVDVTPDYTYLATNPKFVEYNYTLHGEEGTIPYTVYGGMYKVLNDENNGVIYFDNGISKLALDDPRQSYYLDPLVSEIQNITSNRDDQVRIAISLVQQIEYDELALENPYNKYPYEVLYTEKGVCGGKSVLLAYLLRGLGYEVVIFHFVPEEHAAVGIACPRKYSYMGSGYCYVESTFTCPITYSGKLADRIMTSYPYVRRVSDGASFDSVEEDYYYVKRL